MPQIFILCYYIHRDRRPQCPTKDEALDISLVTQDRTTLKILKINPRTTRLMDFYRFDDKL